MTVINALLLIFGILATLVLLCVLAVFLEKKIPWNQYDERQRLSRGNAYRVSFWIGAIYYLCVMVYLIQGVGKDTEQIEGYLLLFAGFVFQAMAFHIYCLLTHCALPLGEKPTASIIGYACLGGVHLLDFVTRPLERNLALSGQESFACVRLMLGVFFFSLAVMHLIRAVWKEKE